MKKSIWKFPLGKLNDVVEVEMPKGADVLCVQVQNGEPAVWAKVNAEDGAPTKKYPFCIRGTGHPLGQVGAYVGSFQLHGGTLVFHVFHA